MKSMFPSESWVTFCTDDESLTSARWEAVRPRRPLNQFDNALKVTTVAPLVKVMPVTFANP